MSKSTNPSTRPSVRALQAHNNALYVVEIMGFNYDPEQGIAESAHYELSFSGTPGEVLANPKFYVPQVGDDIERLDLAFELGYLIGRKQCEAPHA